MQSLIVGILIRHILTALGAYLVAKGWADESTATQILGAASTVGGFALSVVNKIRLTNAAK